VSGTITVTAVPEPTLLALATAGATLLVVFSSRNKR
jgi:hypothetical protein